MDHIWQFGEVNYVVQKHRESRKITLHIVHMKSYDHNDIPECWLSRSPVNDKETQTQSEME